MSYCRSTQDNDVYVWGGHNETIFIAPILNYFDEATGYVTPCGLPYAGECLSFESKENAAGMLVKLRDLGYRVDQNAIDRLLFEHNFGD